MTSTELVTVERPERTLDELAATANREHAAVEAAAAGMLGHAILAGEALNAARARCQRGEWGRWLNANFASGRVSAGIYMRLAHYKPQLATAEAEGVDSIQRAVTWLRGYPEIRSRRESHFTPEVHADAKRLAAGGLSMREVANCLGVSSATARKLVDPTSYERRRLEQLRLKQARRERERALREKQDRKRAEKEAARRAGGGIAEAYSLAERTQDALGRAHREATDREAREALSLAGEYYRKMRDEIVRALGVS